jgi:hypothetical protein
MKVEAVVAVSKSVGELDQPVPSRTPCQQLGVRDHPL